MYIDITAINESKQNIEVHFENDDDRKIWCDSLQTLQIADVVTEIYNTLPAGSKVNTDNKSMVAFNTQGDVSKYMQINEYRKEINKLRDSVPNNTLRMIFRSSHKRDAIEEAIADVCAGKASGNYYLYKTNENTRQMEEKIFGTFGISKKNLEYVHKGETAGLLGNLFKKRK